MSRFRTHHIALIVTTVALAAAGCGGSASSTSQTSPPSAAVARGNAPIKLTFADRGYPAACHKSLETPNEKGNALNPAQAKTFCACLQQQAQSRNLSSQSEQSISNAQFRTLFSACLAQLRGTGTTSAT
jgi:hypothetical protein